jgi:hypothetical protein
MKRFNLIAISLIAMFISSCSRNNGVLDKNEVNPYDEIYPYAEVMVDGMAVAHVYSWHDIDGNGLVDEGEPPIPWVTIKVAYPDYLTGSDGWGYAYEFMPGCAKDCWRGETVEVKTPPGYELTTPNIYPLTGNEVDYYFGFKIIDEKQIISFPGEPDWYKAFTHRGANVIEFHVKGDSLEITLDQEGTILDDYYPYLYEEEFFNRWFFDDFVFDVILSLDRDYGVNIDKVEITLLPGGEVYNCAFAVIWFYDGTIPANEIITKYCGGVEK